MIPLQANLLYSFQNKKLFKVKLIETRIICNKDAEKAIWHLSNYTNRLLDANEPVDISSSMWPDSYGLAWR